MSFFESKEKRKTYFGKCYKRIFVGETIKGKNIQLKKYWDSIIYMYIK